MHVLWTPLELLREYMILRRDQQHFIYAEIRVGNTVLILINAPALINAPTYFWNCINLHDFLFAALADVAL